MRKNSILYTVLEKGVAKRKARVQYKQVYIEEKNLKLKNTSKGGKRDSSNLQEGEEDLQLLQPIALRPV
jgi:hypothetical protein